MLITSFTTLLQECAAEPGTKRLAGNIEQFEQLLDPGIVSRLEAEHGGSFSFLAFDSPGDAAIVDYLRAGTLAADSGDRHLCLFTLRESARGTKRLEDVAWGSSVTIESARPLSAVLLDSAFGDDTPPALPGILLFSSLTRRENAIWVALGECADERAVRQRSRNVFRLANAATQHSLAKKKGTSLVSAALGQALQPDKIPYSRTGSYSAQEWFMSACRAAWAHRSDLVAAASLLAV